MNNLLVVSRENQHTIILKTSEACDVIGITQGELSLFYNKLNPNSSSGTLDKRVQNNYCLSHN